MVASTLRFAEGPTAAKLQRGSLLEILWKAEIPGPHPGCLSFRLELTVIVVLKTLPQYCQISTDHNFNRRGNTLTSKSFISDIFDHSAKENKNATTPLHNFRCKTCETKLLGFNIPEHSHAEDAARVGLHICRDSGLPAED
jgi:hypothetical protein